ncbi:hypothetical protein BDR26DRAFT_952748 [Obelidium mucronatum]|nr:hypothetical protein BDR26DRAFT_952748 [Obelidium mucronatum]
MYTLQNAYHSAFPSVSSDTEQYSGIPSAASSSIFKRAYYLYQMLLLQEYIQDPAVSEVLQAAQEEFDYSCFQPSWGEKGRRLFPYSLHLGEYSSNQVSDNVEDLQSAMKEYVEWMNVHFAVKWKHSCGECHVYCPFQMDPDSGLLLFGAKLDPSQAPNCFQPCSAGLQIPTGLKLSIF